MIWIAGYCGVEIICSDMIWIAGYCGVEIICSDMIWIAGYCGIEGDYIQAECTVILCKLF